MRSMSKDFFHLGGLSLGGLWSPLITKGAPKKKKKEGERKERVKKEKRGKERKEGGQEK